MKILWITNQIFPVVSQYLGENSTVIGGWTYSAASELYKNKNVELAVASLYMGNEYRELCIHGQLYYLIPCNGNKMKYHRSLEVYCNKIKESFVPDVVHIYGTEYPITLAYLNSCGEDNVVVSLQGVPTLYSRYFFSGISVLDILKRPVMLLEKFSFDRSNKYEKRSLSKIKYFEGRSNWDKTVAWKYNPHMVYFHCNRTLRSVFYENKWKIENIERHSLFLSQAQYSIKGVHQMLRALPLILRKYPDTKVYIAGSAPFGKQEFKARIKSLGYGNYIKSLIKKFKLKNHICFCGSLSADQMMKRYLYSHVFISPSAIENVPNSVAEAQILGVPCIASYVGGNNGLIEDGITGVLYRFEEYEMLAKSVCDIFSDDDLANTLSINGRNVALNRHNKSNNISNLIRIYKSIIDKRIV